MAWLQERKLYYIGSALSALFSGGCALLYAQFAALNHLQLMVTVWEWTAAVAIALCLPALMALPADEDKYRQKRYWWRREIFRWLGRGSWITFLMALLARAVFGLGLTPYFVN